MLPLIILATNIYLSHPDYSVIAPVETPEVAQVVEQEPVYTEPEPTSDPAPKPKVGAYNYIDQVQALNPNFEVCADNPYKLCSRQY